MNRKWYVNGTATCSKLSSVPSDDLLFYARNNLNKVTKRWNYFRTSEFMIGKVFNETIIVDKQTWWEQELGIHRDFIREHILTISGCSPYYSKPRYSRIEKWNDYCQEILEAHDVGEMMNISIGNDEEVRYRIRRARPILRGIVRAERADEARKFYPV